jgi:hypothetical protein
MNISSTIIALNYQQNFEEITNAENYLIIIIDETIDLSCICEINSSLQLKNLGKVLPILRQEDSSAFSIVFNNFEELEILLKSIKRMLWELGVLLSTKIVLINPEIKVLKEYGEGE